MEDVLRWVVQQTHGSLVVRVMITERKMPDHDRRLEGHSMELASLKKDILEVKPFVSNKSGAVSSSLGYSASASTGVFSRKFGIHVGTDWICEMPSFVVEELPQRDSMLDGTTRQVIMEHSPEDFVKMPKMRQITGTLSALVPMRQTEWTLMPRVGGV